MRQCVHVGFYRRTSWIWYINAQTFCPITVSGVQCEHRHTHTHARWKRRKETFRKDVMVRMLLDIIWIAAKMLQTYAVGIVCWSSWQRKQPFIYFIAQMMITLTKLFTLLLTFLFSIFYFLLFNSGSIDFEIASILIEFNPRIQFSLRFTFFFYCSQQFTKPK